MKLSNLKPNWGILAAVLGGIVIGVAAVWGYFYFQNRPVSVEPEDQTAGEMMSEDVSSSTPPSDETGMSSDELENGKIVDEGPSANLRINWKEPTALSNDETRALFIASADNKEEAGERFDALASENGYDLVMYRATWEMGTVSGGRYDNAVIYLVKVEVGGLGLTRDYFYLMKPEGEHVLYGIGEEGFGYAFNANVVQLPNVRIPELDMPEILTLANGGTMYKFWYIGFGTDGPIYRHDGDENYYEAAKTQDGRSVYWNYTDESAQGCFLVFAVDGRVYHYAPHIAGKGADISESGMMGDTLVPSISWKSGYENANEYTYRPRTGCGSYGCARIVMDNEVMASGDLVTVGVTSEGDDVVAPKDPSKHPLVQEIYDTWYDPSWYQKGEEFQKPSMEEFLQRFSLPVFFWKDPFDRWNVYTVAGAIPPAECGKPVIYLYPEETTDVRVSLPPSIDVTVSEPAYPDEGWKVTAHPDGSLGYCDGNTYGSLYWEGNGAAYDPPETGFVVADGDVDLFFRVALARYGLNETESREFREFWTPKLTGAPYYRISFLTDTWNKAVPLNVSPRPDTVIRIFMDWKRLQAPESISPPEIETPARDGFTLVEWGGLLY